MNKDKLYRRRLTKLANHLIEGNLGHKNFDFGQWTDSTTAGKCGTSGCAIGECPVVFPGQWGFMIGEGYYDIEPRLRGRGEQSRIKNGILDDAAEFFGLSYNMASHFFRDAHPSNVTAEKVGRYILDWLERNKEPLPMGRQTYAL